jgi:hypothetical protein
MKSHRTLRWVLPSGRVVDAEPTTHGVPDGNTSDVERAVARRFAADA